MNQVADPRDLYIARTVSGQSFADVGGLWGTVNEKISIAHRFGASNLTMLDVSTSDSPLWARFRERMAQLGVARYNTRIGDVCHLAPELSQNPFKVVHCSGVLYHHPSPMMLLLALKLITEEYLILTSAISQEVIENERGRYELPPSGVLFTPALNEQERAVLKVYWEGIGVTAYGITEPVQYNLDSFGPWWWLPTATAMEGMCRAAGFQVVASQPTWAGNAHTVLLRV